jgi:trigger factor
LTITTAPRDDHQITMTIELGPERTAQAVHRAARAVAQKVRIPGFRPGKAPDATVIRLVGRDRALGEIMEALSEEVIKEALEAQSVTSYGRISIEKIETDPIRFTLVLPQPPTVELGDLSGIHIVPPDGEISEAQIDEVIERERASRATLTVVERPAQMGDTVVVDITGVVGEETIMDNHDWELVLKGEGGWLPGFDEAFVGMAAGDEKTFTLTYPADSASRYKGQEAAFQAKVSAVKAQVLPELTDEFARSLGDFASVADMRAQLRDRMTAQRQQDVQNFLDAQAVDALVNTARIVYPPNLLQAEIEEIVEDAERQVKSAGYKLEDYLRLQGLTPETYRERIRPQAEARLKSRLALTEFVRQQQVAVTAEEVQAEAARLDAAIRQNLAQLGYDDDAT